MIENALKLYQKYHSLVHFCFCHYSIHIVNTFLVLFSNNVAKVLAHLLLCLKERCFYTSWQTNILCCMSIIKKHQEKRSSYFCLFCCVFVTFKFLLILFMSYLFQKSSLLINDCINIYTFFIRKSL